MGQEFSNYILRYSFFDQNIGGIVVIIGDTQSEQIMKIDYLVFPKGKVWETFSNQLDELELEKIYKIINEQSQSVENSTCYDQNIVMKNYFGNYPSGKLKRINNVVMTTGDESLRKILLKNVFDEDIKSIFHLEGFQSELFEKIVFHRTLEPEHDEEDEIETDAIFLETTPQIDPSGGVRAADITDENEIFVKITDTTAIGKHFLKTFSKTADEPTEEGGVVKDNWIRVPVVDKETIQISKHRESSDMCDVYVILEEDVYGKFSVQPDIRIKVYSDIFEQQEKQDVQSHDNETIKSSAVRVVKNESQGSQEEHNTDDAMNPLFIGSLVAFIIIFFLIVIFLFR